MKNKWLRIAALGALMALAVAAFAQNPGGLGPKPGGIGQKQKQQRKPNPAEAQKGTRRALPWSLAAGRPTITKDSVGFFIWHQDDTVYLLSCGETQIGQKFAGKIRVKGGAIANAKAIMNEKNDKFITQTRPDELTFRFDVHEAQDGVRFTLTQGTHIVFGLQREGKKSDQIYIGAKNFHARVNPVVFNLSR